MSLKAKVITGAFWSLLEKGGQQALSLLVFFVLARILGPEDYGLANICFIFFTLTTMVTAGLVDGVVSNQVEDKTKLSSLFWGISGIGLTISFICILFAKPLAILVKEPELEPILVWFSVVPLLVSLASIPNILLLKELDFKVYAIRSIISTIIGGVVGIYMALNDYGAYAIVGQQIAIFFCTNIIIWRSIAWRPHATFENKVFLNEIKPGISVMGANVLAFLNEQFPRLMIATILGTGSLGYFALATRLKFSLSEILITSPLAVVYPALAKLNDDQEKQANIASSISYLSAIIVYPILTIAIATAPYYIPILFGSKWESATPILQAYLLGISTTPTLLIIQFLFRSNNMMKRYVLTNVYFIALYILMSGVLFLDNGLIILPLTHFVISCIACIYYQKMLKKKITDKINLINLSSLRPLLACILTYIGITTSIEHINHILINPIPILSLSAYIAVGLFIYLIYFFYFEYKRTLEIFKNIKPTN